MSHVDVLGVGVGDKVLRKLHRTLIILEHRYAWHAYMPTSGDMKRRTCLENILLP